MADQNDNRGLASADEETRERVAHEGGEARKNQGADYSELGKKGGKAAQQSDHAHTLTNEERSQGGKAAHESGNAHEWDSEEASEAGQKGGSR